MALALFAAAVVLFVVIRGGGVEESAGDLTYVPGTSEPNAEDIPSEVPASIADIVAADVKSDGEGVIFTTEVASPLPNELDDSSLEFRWDVSGDGGGSWIVSATLNVALNAAVVSQGTPYGSSTIDGTMPGEVSAAGPKVTVAVRPDEIEGFPTSFTWKLSTTLIADRTDPGSARAEDAAPDEGTATFGAGGSMVAQVQGQT